ARNQVGRTVVIKVRRRNRRQPEVRRHRQSPGGEPSAAIVAIERWKICPHCERTCWRPIRSDKIDVAVVVKVGPDGNEQRLVRERGGQSEGFQKAAPLLSQYDERVA